MIMSDNLALNHSGGGVLQAGYFLKAVVLAVSSFKEVLFLDADNVPVADPTGLFHAEEYERTGALFWRDFWDPSWAPDAPAVLNISSERMPSYTIDSGQMLVDKSRYEFWSVSTNLRTAVTS
jgi:alpha 1,2-mannosyltransferase